MKKETFKNAMINIFLHKRNMAMLPIFTALILAVSITSCVKEYLDLNKLDKTAELNLSFVGPVAYGNFTAQDLLSKFDKNSKINQYTSGVDDKLLFIVFDDIVESKLGNEIIEIPNNSLRHGLSLLPPLGAIETSTAIPKQSLTATLFQHDRPRVIKEIKIDTGTLDVVVDWQFNNDAIINLYFPLYRSSDNQQLVIQNINVNANQTVFRGPIDIAGYTLKLNQNSNLEDYAVVQLDGSVKNLGIANDPATDTAAITMNLTNIKFESIKGYMGSDTLIQEDSVELGITMLENTSEFYFADPRLKFKIQNTFGVPSQIEISNMEIIDENDIHHAFTLTQNIIPVKYPLINQIGQSISDSFEINKNNSNIDQIINTKPKYLKYKILSVTNPAGVVDMNQFVLKSSKNDVTASMELPMYGFTKNYVYTDTTELDMKEEVFKYNPNLEKLLIKIQLDNGLPIDINTQVYFLDSNKVRVDSLFIDGSNMLADAPQITIATGGGKRANGVQKTVSDIIITGARLNALKEFNIKSLEFAIKMDTYNSAMSENIKMYSTDIFNIKVMMDVSGKINTSDLE